MKLPPHTTHVLQPLDVAVFRSLKQKWDKELCKWQRQNPRRKIPKSDFIAILTKATNDISPTCITNGFRATGIYDPEIKGPNSNAIPESIFKPEDLKRYKKNLPQNGTQEDGSTTDQPLQIMEPPVPVYSALSEETVSTEMPLCSMRPPAMVQSSTTDQILPAEQTQTFMKNRVTEQSSTTDLILPAKQTQTFMENRVPEQSSSVVLPAEQPPTLMDPQVTEAPSSQEILCPERPSTYQENSATDCPSTSGQQCNFQGKRSFEDLILDLLKTGQKQDKPKKRKKIVHNCEIITSKEYLLMIENKEKDKLKAAEVKEHKRKERELLAKIKKEKKTQIAKKKSKRCKEPISESSTEDSDTYSVQESQEGYHESFSENEDNSLDSLSKGGFCIVKVFGKTPNSFRLYVAKVLHNVNNGYEVHFFKRHQQTMKFLETDEESFVGNTDVVLKLSSPVISSSARFKNMIGFQPT